MLRSTATPDNKRSVKAKHSISDIYLVDSLIEKELAVLPEQ